jgi:hypothetical protein
MTNPNEFSVYQFFPDGSYEKVKEFVPVHEAVACAKRLTETVGAKVGITRRVIITDGGDCIAFEWCSGEGVTFPERKRHGKVATRDRRTAG